MAFTHVLTAMAAGPQVTFPQGPAITEQIALRWLHIVAGIIWIGTLYFNNLAATPALKLLDPPVRAKIYPALMSRAMWWFRWSALVTVIAGLRYAFPRAMARIEKSHRKVAALHDRVAERPRIAAYLASERRIPFNEQGIFRHYPELESPPHFK